MINAILSFFRKPFDKPTPWQVRTNAFADVFIQRGTESRRIVSFPYAYRFPDNSTREHYWCHPDGHPFQIYGGPYAPEASQYQQQVWTNIPELPGYKLVMDDHSDRLYLIWIGPDAPVVQP